MKPILILFLVAVATVNGIPTEEEYFQMRDEFLSTEQSMMLGSSLVLNTKELEVDAILMGLKQREYDEGLRLNGQFFATTQHYFHSKPLFEASDVHNIIRMLPKGAALHMHDLTVGYPEYAVANLTRRDGLYSCMMPDEHLMFRFFAEAPTEGCTTNSNWTLVADMRENASSEEYIDQWFLKCTSMFTTTPEVDYPDTNRAWYWFEKKISTLSGIVTYEGTMGDFYYDTLARFAEDNVMYIEMRGLLEGHYDLEGEMSYMEALQIYEAVTTQFVNEHPNFFGAKYIYAPHRYGTPEEIGSLIDKAVLMKEAAPDFFAGFDLVGQEDVNPRLIEFIPQLLDAASRDIQFFFHAGETAWRGTGIDENLIDAVLLNTTRIGHGFALADHPYAMELVQAQQIGVEVCPISNQVLRLNEDFRNHPATNLMRDGFPLVIASDGPGIWAARPLSDDWYVAFMAMGGKRADLRFLKQLAINSIQFSAMSPTEKIDAMAFWQTQWDAFLDQVIATYGTK